MLASPFLFGVTMNQQPIEKQITDSDQLDVVNVWKTIQGEGPFAGTPAVFVRLAGCNLQCSLCDTDYTSDRHLITPDQLEWKIRAFDTRLVVFTGGEPFRQPLRVITNRLIAHMALVQIETNGTLYQELSWYRDRDLTVVCSPKTPTLNRQLIPHITAYKYVLQAGHVADDGLPSSSMGDDVAIARPPAGAQVFIQPLDEGIPDNNKRNLDAAVASCMKHGYRLSYQLHKLIGVE